MRGIRQQRQAVGQQAADDLDDFYPVLNGLAGEANDRQIALAAVRLYHELSGKVADETEIPDISPRPRESRGERPGGRPGERPNKREGGGATGFVYVSLGRGVGIRPGDLVGAIANETGLAGRDIGPIRITERFSVVGVPAQSVNTVIAALKSTAIKGRRPNVRPYTD